QDGRKLRFFSDLVKGKTVAVNFIFTTCTTICPPLTATFRKVQQDLGERVGRDIHLISISVDPATDVPERLKAFAAKFKAGPGWSFVTGGKQDIDGLLLALGASIADKNDHTPMVLVGNESAGIWTRTYGLSTPQTLVKVITDAADARPSASEGSVEVPAPGGAQAPARETAEAARPAPGGDTGKAAESAARYFPNTELLTQENKPVRFFDDLLKGKVVLINFAFSTCTGVCSPMTANLAKVQEYLGDRVGRDINMITISVDPLVDTPEVLKKYASSFKVKPGWYFLTGKKENIDLVLKKLGGYVADKSQHSGVLIVGNVETGEWSKVFAMAKASEIADIVRKVADSKQ
ncbi:MAG TPA: SCO family protein, partial [Blastocatellia bacterium]|nr:SCO family protein [Blastocatellia bacterium]